MAYCQECGSHMDQDTTTCSSCGNKLIDGAQTKVPLSKATPEVNQEVNQWEADGNSESSSETSVSNQALFATEAETIKEPEKSARGLEPNSNLVFKENPIPQEGVIAPHWNQAESHLGKGLIKPVAIENCMDGYHFKYDEPPRQIIQPDQQKEKVVEFRFSGETGPVEESKEVRVSDGAEKVPEGGLDITETDLEQEELEATPESATEPTPETIQDSVTEVTTEPILGPELKVESPQEAPDFNETEPGEARPLSEDSLPEKELISEAERMELEIRVETEPEFQPELEPALLWEGHRSWNGLAQKEVYQVTERAVVLLGSDGQRLKTVEWKSVSKIDLKQNWLTKFLDIGNLEIIGHNSEPLLILEGVEHPKGLQKILVEMIGSKAL